MREETVKLLYTIHYNLVDLCNDPEFKESGPAAKNYLQHTPMRDAMLNILEYCARQPWAGTPESTKSPLDYARDYFGLIASEEKLQAALLAKAKFGLTGDQFSTFNTLNMMLPYLSRDPLPTDPGRFIVEESPVEDPDSES